MAFNKPDVSLSVPYDIEERRTYIIDGDDSIQATLTAILLTFGGRIQYECVWVHNGAHASAYIDHHRLSVYHGDPRS